VPSFETCPQRGWPTTSSASQTTSSYSWSYGGNTYTYTYTSTEGAPVITRVAGKTFESWPEMVDNVIPYIGGEEEKTQQEPLKIWGTMVDGKIQTAASPLITAQCIRVAASDGHMAAVSVAFEHKPSKDEILAAWKAYAGKPQHAKLPSAPRRRNSRARRGFSRTVNRPTSSC